VPRDSYKASLCSLSLSLSFDFTKTYNKSTRCFGMEKRRKEQPPKISRAQTHDLCFLPRGLNFCTDIKCVQYSKPLYVLYVLLKIHVISLMYGEKSQPSHKRPSSPLPLYFFHRKIQYTMCKNEGYRFHGECVRSCRNVPQTFRVLPSFRWN
jgi:hypothetical protein